MTRSARLDRIAMRHFSLTLPARKRSSAAGVLKVRGVLEVRGVLDTHHTAGEFWGSSVGEFCGGSCGGVLDTHHSGASTAT